ncbi:ATP diphosphohydrolase [Novymonas esmeraldas]|uniref:ATP diphosphohydrolase n=1 Tax=Novymonas esmeraldas TaxID=1808958 RepID=A0AAW0EU38_9TRYP
MDAQHSSAVDDVVVPLKSGPATLNWMRQYTAVRRTPQQVKRLRLISVLIVGALLLFGVLSYLQRPNLVPCDSPYAHIYDVVIDAGSTGSRVHIFKYERSSGGDVVLLHEHFQRVEPGLSSFAANPSGASQSLQVLLKTAAEAVPLSHHECTAIALRATAGLRLLPDASQQAVLNAATRALEASPFASRGASIISGAQEGVYGWLTVNYLLRTLGSADATVATIDMGGASTQVVFETSRASGEWLPFNYAHQLRLPRRTVSMYQHSYLGLGLNEARRTMTAAFAAANSTASFACYPTGHTQRVSDTELHNSDAADFGACAALFRHHVLTRTPCQFAACGARGVPQPRLPSRAHAVYAFSYFYDRLSRVRAEGSPVTVSSYRDVGEEVCRRESTRRTSASTETVCMDLAYLYSFLTYGLGLSDDTVLTVPNRIDGMAVSWSLGSSLSYVLRME